MKATIKYGKEIWELHFCPFCSLKAIEIKIIEQGKSGYKCPAGCWIIIYSSD